MTTRQFRRGDHAECWVATDLGEFLLGAWRCPRCQLLYGAPSDSTVAHRTRGLSTCIACAESQR